MPALLRRLLPAVAALGLLPAAARAEAPWPNRPVKVIVPYAPGGSTDATGRAYAEKLSQALGQQFVVENRSGASGTVGMEACGKSPADGYTICLMSVTFTIVPHMRTVPYDQFRDFTPIGRVVDLVFGFAVHSSVPAKTLPEFIALAKQTPGKLRFGTSGMGSITQIAVELMKKEAGFDLVHVPYRGGAESLTDLLGGHIESQLEGNAFPHHASGKVRVLAVTSDVRHPLYPDIPTVKETLPGYALPAWTGFFAPSGTPRAVIDRMVPVLNESAKAQDLRDRLLALGMAPRTDTPEDAAKDLKVQDAKYAALVKELNLKME